MKNVNDDEWSELFHAHALAKIKRMLLGLYVFNPDLLHNHFVCLFFCQIYV